MIRPRPDHTRRCPAQCGRLLEPDRALCPDHWDALRPAQRERIAKAWALKDFAGWAHAMRDATDSINETERQRELDNG